MRTSSRDAGGTEYPSRGLDSPDSNVDFGVYVPNINDTHPSHPNCTEFSIPFELVRRNRQLLYKSSPPDRTKDAINDLITEYFHNHNAPYTYGEFSNFADNMLDEDEDRITENRASRQPPANASWGSTSLTEFSTTATSRCSTSPARCFLRGRSPSYRLIISVWIDRPLSGILFACPCRHE